jgi:hypothetical protein
VGRPVPGPRRGGRCPLPRDDHHAKQDGRLGGEHILEVIDGQQRLPTLTLLLTAIYSSLRQQGDLDDEVTVDVVNLGRSLVRKSDEKPRVTPQLQGHNLDDYLAVLRDAGLKVDAVKQPYFPLRRVAKCFAYFEKAIQNLAETDHAGDVVGHVAHEEEAGASSG